MKRKIHLSVLSVKLLAFASLFGIFMFAIISFMSYKEFKKQLEGVYGDSTKQFAQTAISYVDSERISYWLTEGNDGLWDSTNQRLNELTETAEIAFIYLTVVAPDYTSRTYIFDTVNSLVASEPYPLGYVESLAKKNAVYIENLRRIIENGESLSFFSYKKSGGHVTTSVPVRDFTGKVVAVLSVVKPMKEVEAYIHNYLRPTLIAALVFTLLFILLYALSLLLSVIKPLMLIIDETTHFAEHHGELSGVLKKIKNRDELGLLAKSVEKMSGDMNRYISDLTQATAERERIGAELNVATKIQAEMLPRVFPPYKNHPEISLFASMSPAKEVGGDFYDFFMIDDDHFTVVVADVSGKGVPAALFMVVAKTLLKEAAFRFKTPAEIFDHVNRALCEGNESGLFVTCWMAILELSTGKLTFSNAGHTAPVICKGGEVSYLESKPNLMLAAMEGIPYQNHEISILPGDKLFLYTDGVTEATDSANQLYGEERLLSVLKRDEAFKMSPKEIVDFVRKDIDGFVNGADQFDDITMLEMEFIGNPDLKNENGGAAKMSELTITAEDCNIEKVNDFIHSCLPENCSPILINKIDLAVEEIFVNIAHYAYTPEVGEARVSAAFADNVLTMIFKDKGKPFNPIAKQDPDLSLSAEEREIGGLGIFLTKKFMDIVEYEYADGQNILTIKKAIE
ncbi:SpoIIE family protein phosphatase [uncultured Treponema sp.]|uniref:ATP-binding SpoIIE family protein phosphatase n=1 Tax=uncultured Treponema sp. TaxID=162155 RepID=UPI0025DE1823|nr:SpoIIE family protein phosphatase [uncultured Treponema sp.]